MRRQEFTFSQKDTALGDITVTISVALPEHLNAETQSRNRTPISTAEKKRPGRPRKPDFEEALREATTV